MHYDSVSLYLGLAWLCLAPSDPSFPWERAALRQMVLELVIRRVLELKHELVKWNPPNVDVRFPPPAPAQPFPWDYVNLDDILVDLKLSPDTLDVAVPRREENVIYNSAGLSCERGSIFSVLV